MAGDVLGQIVHPSGEDVGEGAVVVVGESSVSNI